MQLTKNLIKEKIITVDPVAGIGLNLKRKENRGLCHSMDKFFEEFRRIERIKHYQNQVCISLGN